jgi:hypothetical protein
MSAELMAWRDEVKASNEYLPEFSIVIQGCVKICKFCVLFGNTVHTSVFMFL